MTNIAARPLQCMSDNELSQHWAKEYVSKLTPAQLECVSKTPSQIQGEDTVLQEAKRVWEAICSRPQLAERIEAYRCLHPPSV